jgi:hypothetical protein
MMPFPIDAFSLDKPAPLRVRCLRSKGSFYQPNRIAGRGDSARAARREVHLAL